MYTTKRATKEDELQMRKSIPSPLGHTVTGYDASFSPVIETSHETSALAIPEVVHLRIKQMNGKYMYRTIVQRP